MSLQAACEQSKLCVWDARMSVCPLFILSDVTCSQLLEVTEGHFHVAPSRNSLHECLLLQIQQESLSAEGHPSDL